MSARPPRRPGDDWAGPLDRPDPVRDYFTRERALVRPEPADDDRWQEIVAASSTGVRPRWGRWAAVAAAVLLVSAGVGAIASRQLPLPTPVATAPSHPTVPRPTVTTTPPPTPTGSSTRTDGAVPRSFQVLSLTTARAGMLFALGRVDCGAGTCAALVVSTDNGASWALRHTFTAGTLVPVAPSGRPGGSGQLSDVRFANASVGWVFGGAALRTTDGGVTWQTYAHPGGDVLALETDGRDVVLTAANRCVDRTCSGPLTVVRAPVGAAAATNTAGVVNGLVNITSAAVTWHQGLAYVSPLGQPASGQGRPSPVVVRPDGLHPVDPASCASSYGWTQLVGSASGASLFAVCADSGAMGHLGYAVSSSSTGGASWRPVSADALVLVNAGSTTYAAADPSSLVAASGGTPDLHGSLAVSTDGGVTWHSPSRPPTLPDHGWAWVGAPGGPTFYAIGGDPSGQFWRSVDRGQTWAAVRIG